MLDYQRDSLSKTVIFIGCITNSYYYIFWLASLAPARGKGVSILAMPKIETHPPLFASEKA
jgi:hypothetical protein